MLTKKLRNTNRNTLMDTSGFGKNRERNLRQNEKAVRNYRDFGRVEGAIDARLDLARRLALQLGTTPNWRRFAATRHARPQRSAFRFKKGQRIALSGRHHQKSLKLVRGRIFSAGITKVAVLKFAI